MPYKSENGAVNNGAILPDLTYTLDEAVNKVGYGLFQRRLICLSGLAWTADACEIIILSVIGQILACQWDIYRWQNALLTSVVFLGMMIGSPIFGIVADKFGRKKSLTASLCLLFSFGALSASSPSYPWMLVFRASTGFALGGVPQLLTLCCEYCPTSMRGRAGFYLCYFWGLGTIAVILLSWVVMINTGNWRLLLAIASLPTLLVLICIKWFPESVRYNLVSDRIDEAEKILQQMARMNDRTLPPGHLQSFVQCCNRGNIVDLFTPAYRRSTLLFWYLWLATAFGYYSIALVSPIIIQSGSIASLYVTNATSTGYFSDLKSLEPCMEMTNQNYIDLLWTSAAELPGLLIFTILVEICDRKKLMCGSCIISSVLMLLLLFDTKKVLMLSFLFAARAIILAVFQLTLLMTSEAFPTTLRAVAIGTGSAFCRFGGFASPYVSQVLIVSNPAAAIGIMAGFVLMAGIAAICLPLETRRMDLLEFHEIVEKTDKS